VLSRGEELQDRMRKAIRDERLSFRIGDVRDYHTVAAVLRGADVVFHAAALKQIPACEANPRETVETNVNGTANIIRAICDFGFPVETVVGISTDKACRPVNVYGMTKAVGERLFTEAALASRTRFVTVRYGNVLVSRGSVIPLFAEQILKGGPVTVTTKEMTRFFLSVEEAVDAALTTFEYARSGEVYVPLLGSARVVDLARMMIGDKDVSVAYNGMRPGEKVHEILISPEESERTVHAEEGYLAVRPMLEGFPTDNRPAAFDEGWEFSSAEWLMSPQRLRRYIEDVLREGEAYVHRVPGEDPEHRGPAEARRVGAPAGH
jgi:UDP-glucose 4-epimerase